MYLTLFRSVTKAIQLLQEAQQETEAIYIESEPTGAILLTFIKQEGEPVPIGQMKSNRGTAGHS
jgi:hypothetical protein